jgi:2-dehydropantoate 2-reductase
MASIALIGPGAIGGTVGLALAQQGHDLVICANQAFSELAVTRADTKARKSHPVRVITSPPDSSRADWVLLCVKSHQTDSAAAWLKATIGPGNAVVPVVVMLPAERTSPGEIVLHGSAALTAPDDAAGREFAELFAGSFVRANTDADLTSRAWEKLCLNAPGGALSVLTLHPGPIAESKELADLAARLVEECMAVGRAEGATFPDGFAKSIVAMFSRPGSRGNSMYYDRRDGKPLEWDARNGVIQRLGRKHGIATPISDVLVPILKLLSP